MIKLGTCGWSGFPANKIWKNWKERFSSKLEAYASLLNTVEINSTFYKLPRQSTARRWLEEARKSNKGFEFTVKANREITHIDRFKTDKSIKSWKSTVEIAGILEAKIILLQTPASFKPTVKNLSTIQNFLSKLEWSGKTAWEPRGEWLRKPELIKRLCDEFDIIHCVDPFRAKSVTQEVYWRLHGLGKPSMYKYKFSGEDLKWLANKLSGRKGGHVFFNNIWMGEDVLRFKRIFKQVSPLSFPHKSIS